MRLLIIFLPLLFFSCSKTQKNKKRLLGTWHIVSYRTIESTGLTTQHEAEGNFHFNDVDPNSFYLEQDFSIVEGSNTTEVLKTGTGTFLDNKGEYFDLQLDSPTTELLDDCRIILITKDDLKLEMTDNTTNHLFILQK